VRIIGEFTDWTGHSAEQLQSMRDAPADRKSKGLDVIDD
jgi:rifampin ADP-ribosylating transferase